MENKTIKAVLLTAGTDNTQGDGLETFKTEITAEDLRNVFKKYYKLTCISKRKIHGRRVIEVSEEIWSYLHDHIEITEGYQKLISSVHLFSKENTHVLVTKEAVFNDALENYNKILNENKQELQEKLGIINEEINNVEALTRDYGLPKMEE